MNFEYIFSIKNKMGYKVITILGNEFKFRSTKARVSELEKIVKKMDSLLYIINSTADITKCKSATGDFRKLQMLRLKMLNLCVNIFDKNGIRYWLDYGTLIGVIRHKGFIPWDDDIDICMLREDYQKAFNILNTIFKDTDIFAELGGIGRLTSKSMKIKNKRNNLYYFDIFPFDICTNEELVYDELLNKIKKIQSEIYPKWEKETPEVVTAKVIKEYAKYKITVLDKPIKYLFRGLESMQHQGYQTIYKYEDIFPLKKMEFEGFKFFVPNKPDVSIKYANEKSYGDIMSFPPLSELSIHKAYENLKDREYVKFLVEDEKYVDNLAEKIGKKIRNMEDLCN